MLGAILFLSPVTVRLSFALCFMGFCWLVFSDGRDATVAPPSLWFGRALVWELGELGSIPDAAVSLP